MADQADYIAQRLRALQEAIDESYSRHIGFPAAKDFDYSEVYPFFGYMLNNVGDPYEMALNLQPGKEMEREVIDFFADLFRASKNDRWGYVTTGGTEGNLYALYIARELYPKARVYFSADAHYSLPKNAHLLRLPATIVKSQQNGEMDYDDLQTQLAKHKNRPAIVVATIGTTMSEARDDVSKIKKALDGAGVSDRYIHSDAALTGTYAALLKPHRPFDFKDGADSISTSGHKFIGSPVACGVVIIRKNLRDQVSYSAKYTGVQDTTISGSRGGQAPIMLWYAIQKWGAEGFRSRAEASLAMAEYTQQKLQSLGWPTWRNPGAITVMLAAPPEKLTRKWQLATHDGWSHVVCMPGVSRADIDDFLSDLAASG